jgi:TolA-binding protein
VIREPSWEDARLHQCALSAERNSRRSAERLLQVEQILAQAQARIDALEASLDRQQQTAEQLRQRLQRAGQVTEAMKASLSWRLTIPVRVLKRVTRPS